MRAVRRPAEFLVLVSSMVSFALAGCDTLPWNEHVRLEHAESIQPELQSTADDTDYGDMRSGATAPTGTVRDSTSQSTKKTAVVLIDYVNASRSLSTDELMREKERARLRFVEAGHG